MHGTFRSRGQNLFSRDQLPPEIGKHRPSLLRISILPPWRFKDSNTVRNPHFEILLTAINGTDVADFTSRLWAQR